MPGNLGVLGKGGVAIGHPTEEKGIVLGKPPDFALGRAFGNGERDSHEFLYSRGEKSST